MAGKCPIKNIHLFLQILKNHLEQQSLTQYAIRPVTSEMLIWIGHI